MKARNAMTLAALLVFAPALSGPADGATLDGNYSAGSGAVNLTASGPLDWAHWVRQNGSEPDESLTPAERKSVGTPLISTLSLSAGHTLGDTTARNGPYSWTDGSPTASGSTGSLTAPRGPTSGIDTGVNSVLSLTAPASNTLVRNLNVYVAGYNATGQFTASLPGAADYTKTVGFAGPGTGGFRVSYLADNPSDVLTVQWKKTADGGSNDNISIEAATLAEGAFLASSFAVGKFTNVDLTTDGPADWNLWGTGGDTSFTTPSEQKAGGSAIGSLTDIDPHSRGLESKSTSNLHTFDWSDGDPTTDGTGVHGGIIHGVDSGIDSGFSYDLPAGTIPQTVKIYTTAYHADARLTATLSDGSLGPIVDTSLTASGGSSVSGVFTLTYAAASDGETLTVELLQSADHGSSDQIVLHAVSTNAVAHVSDIPEPATVLLAVMGLGALGRYVRSSRVKSRPRRR